MAKILKVLCAMLIVLSIAGCSSTEEKQTSAAEEDTVSDTPKSGENGFLNEEVVIGLGESKKNYDEFFKYITAGNEDAVNQMQADGKVIVAEKGAAITVVDLDMISAKIRIVDTQEVGWVPVEYLTKTKP